MEIRTVYVTRSAALTGSTGQRTAVVIRLVFGICHGKLDVFKTEEMLGESLRVC